ncbi:MAG: signal recognition particle receptor subunit alpha, partial [Beijerinckiaceae bacterium]
MDSLPAQEIDTPALMDENTARIAAEIESARHQAAESETQRLAQTAATQEQRALERAAIAADAERLLAQKAEQEKLAQEKKAEEKLTAKKAKAEVAAAAIEAATIAAAATTIPLPVPAPKSSWWQKLKSGLSRTAGGMSEGITSLFTKRKLDAATLEDLEDILIQADLGLDVAARIAAAVGKGRYDKEIEPEEVKAILAEEVARVLAPVAIPLVLDATRKPFVLLMVGVN